LSLEQTTELVRIVWGDHPVAELEEFLAQYGYDEGTEQDLIYAETEIRYTHRYAAGLKED
jgi:hypothetical protein